MTTDQPVAGHNPVGDFLRRRRVATGITQTELARRIGVAAGSVSRYEANKILPEPENVLAMARELSFNPAVLLEVVARIGVARDAGWDGATPLPGITFDLDRSITTSTPSAPARRDTHDIRKNGSGKTVAIPLLDSTLVGGVGLDALPAVLSSWAGETELVGLDHAECFAVDNPCTGMSRRIPKGARMIVDPTDREFRAGGIYLLRREGKIMARVAFGDGERARFEPDSIEGGLSPIYFTERNGVEIVGRVLSHSIKHDFPPANA